MMRLRCDGDTWAVVLSESITVGGFSTEATAGQWLIDYFASVRLTQAENERRNRMMAAVLLEPGRPQ